MPTVAPSPSATAVTLAQVVDGPLPPGLKVLFAEGFKAEGKSVIWMASVDDLSRVQIIATFPYDRPPQAGGLPGGYISPDGRKLAYILPGIHVQEGSLGVMDIDGSDQRSLASPVLGWGTEYDVTWSPDSRWLAYMVAEPIAPGATQLSLIGADGSEGTLLGTGGVIGLLGCTAPDRLWYLDEAVLRCVDTQTLSVTAIPAVSGASRCRLAPGGQRLACLTARGTALEVVGLDGSDRRVLLENVDPHDLDFENYQLWPVWSPDGRSLAYSRIADRKHTEVVVAHLDTGATELLLQDAADVYHLPISWSPDGRFITVWVVPLPVRDGQSYEALVGLDGRVRKVRRLRPDSLPLHFIGWLPE
jgi:dipeptidyl aminopeptidase/acylaminoacyl peptidase